MFYQSKMLVYDAWARDSTIFLVYLQTAQTKPTDSNFKFNSLWIIEKNTFGK